MSNVCVSFDPSRKDFEPYGLTCVNWQPTLMPRPDHHNEIELNLLRSGSVTYLLGGKKVTVEAGRISLFWGAIPHQIVDFEVEDPYFVATIPLHTFLEWRLPDSFVQSIMQGHLLSEPENPDLSSDHVFFDRWISDLENSKHSESLVLLELHARIARLASRFQAGSENGGLSNVSDVGLSKVEKIACHIAKNYTQKITVEGVSKLVGLHPNYAMGLFQKTFGTTLVNYLTQHRLSHAQRMLTTTEQPITDIALQSGFQSISRFNDVFNRSFGCSPRAYRKFHR